jgi:signal transduction histidine kinase
MKKMNVDLAVPCFSKKKKNLAGFLLAGEKNSQDAFSAEELLLLETMANQAVMSIENAILYQGRIEAAKKRILMKRLSELGQAASNVARQARLALSPVIEFAKQFSQKWDDTGFVEKSAGTLPFETERLRLVLMSVLIYSKQAKPAFDEINLKKEIFSWLSKLLEARAREKNIGIEYNVSDDLVIKMGRDNIKQVLLNLVLNAFDAMPYGGKITLSAEKWEGKVYIKVRDSGQGIPKEKLDKIFNPFFTTKPDAIGLGLTVVKKIIDSYNGAIYVNDLQGQGTEFVVEINA